MNKLPKAMAAFCDAAPFGADARALKELLNKPAVSNDGGRFSVNAQLLSRQAEVGAASARLASNFDRGDFKSGARLSPQPGQQIEAHKAAMK